MSVNIKQLAKKIGLSPIVCSCGRRIHIMDALMAFFELIVKECREGNTVRIKNFGTFAAKEYKGRKLVTPVMDGGEISFGDSLALRFRQSQVAKMKLNKAKKEN